jgi:hypothetical protein
MTMYARTFSLLCVVALFASVGADAPKEGKKKERSPYAGTYTGTFTACNAAGDQEGEITLTVDEFGNSKGESFNKTANLKATLKGTLLKDNKAVLVIEFPNGKSNAYGTISRSANGGVTGTMIQRVGTQVICGIEFELSPKKEAAKEEAKAKE